jgi:hypothetical protein
VAYRLPADLQPGLEHAIRGDARTSFQATSLPIDRIAAAAASADALLMPSSVNAFRAEHRQLPRVRSLIVANEVRVAIRASHFEVPVVWRQPRVEHFRDGDAMISKNQRAWRLLAAMACIALDANAKQLPLSHLIVVRR